MGKSLAGPRHLLNGIRVYVQESSRGEFIALGDSPRTGFNPKAELNLVRNHDESMSLWGEVFGVPRGEFQFVLNR